MKKTFKIIGITAAGLIAVVLLSAILIPVLCKDKLLTMAKQTANDNLNAVVDFGDFDLSVFKNFPRLTVSVDSLTIVGVDKFASDTLASVGSLSASINIMSYLKNDIIDIKSIDIKSPRISAKVLPDSTANWDITKPSTEEETSDTTSTPFNMKIDRFVITDGALVYQDMAGGLIAAVDSLNFSLKGDLSDKRSLLEVLLACRNINVIQGSTKWLAGASLDVNSNIDADLENMLFTLKKTDIDINRIALGAEGSVKMEPNDDMIIDLKYSARVASLQTLLQMIPASVLPDVKNVDTKGEMTLGGWVKGVYNKTSMPQAWVEMAVKDGYVKYASLPQSVDDINIDAKALYDGNNDLNTKVEINRFHFATAGNPFDASATITTPVTDADIRAAIKGRIDFTSLKSALPLQGTDLNGIMTADIKFAGRMSAIEKEQYDKLNLDGKLGIQDFSAKTAEFPQIIKISSASLGFTPKIVNLESFNAMIGSSDIKASGKLENFLNYALKDETLKGNLQISSNLINCNELMAGGTTEEQTKSAPMEVIVLPSNVDFNATAKIGKILYDNLALTDAAGGVGIKNGVLTLSNFGAKLAGGTINLSGNYAATDAASAMTAMNMSVKNIEVKDMIQSFDMFSKIAPVLSQVGGKVSMNFNFSDKLDKNMNPLLAVMNAVGSFEAQNLQLIDAKNLTTITSLLGIKEKGSVLKNVNASFTVADGKVGIKPFSTAIGETPIMIGGDYGIDGTINSQIDFKIPAAAVTSAVNSVLGQLGSTGKVTANSVNVGVAIGGTIKNPTFKPAKAKYMTDSPSVTDQAKDQATQVIEDKTKELQQKATEEATNQANKAASKLLDNIFKKK